MAARRIDVLLVDQTEHLAYLAGWHASGSRYHGCLVPSDGDPVMVFRQLDEPAFLERSWLRDHVCFPDTEDPVEAVVRTITARGWAAARLGVETDAHYRAPRWPTSRRCSASCGSGNHRARSNTSARPRALPIRRCATPSARSG